MLDSPLRCIALLVALTTLPGNAQTSLNFNTPVEATNAQYPNVSSLGPDYYTGRSMSFRNVATVNGVSVDARISLTSTSGSYDLVGWIPKYNSGSSVGDLGIYAVYNGPQPDVSTPAVGGISYTLTFYEGGDLAPGELFSTEFVVPEFSLLVYDHDGEPAQSEAIRTFFSDGFTGYQIRNGSGITAVNDGSSVTLQSRGLNHPETNDEGSFIAYYQQTSSVTFELLASTTHDAVGPAGSFGNTYGIFTAFDGNLSLINGNTANFGTFVPVPEPASVLLCMVGMTAGIFRRQR